MLRPGLDLPRPNPYYVEPIYNEAGKIINEQELTSEDGDPIILE